MSLYIRYVPTVLGGGSGGGGGVSSIGTLDGNGASLNGATINGSVLFMQSASASDAGLVNTGTQSFAGNKTFTGTIGASNLSGTNTGDVTIGTANGLSLSAQALSLALSSTSTTGALSSTDWNTFNGKQGAGNYITALTGDGTASGPGSAALTLATVNLNVGSFTLANVTVNAKGLVTAASSTAIGNLTAAGTDGIAVTSGTGAVVGSGTSIAQHVADTTHNGYLSSTDWNTFNGKQAAGSYITALTGNVAASGPGSAVATIQAGVIVNSMVSATAGIAYSKLNLTGDILDADINASAAIAFSKLATLTSAHLLVGNVSGVAASVAVTGDISLTNAGVTAYSGTVPINKGGTGQTTAANAINALLPSQTGNSGKFLTTDGSVSSWGSPAGGTKLFAQMVNTADQTGLVSATFTKVSFNSATIDPSSICDTTNHRILPGVAGTYLISAGVTMNGGSAVLNRCIYAVYKNGVIALQADGGTGTPSTGSSTAGGTVSYMCTLTNTDYVEIFVRSTVSGGTAWSISSNGATTPDISYFNILQL